MALGESEGGGGEDNMGLLSSPSQPLSNTITPLGLANFWDGIIISLISIGGSITAYFIISYFLKRTADSLNLDRRDLKGINSITKMILIVITITIIIFQFSSVSGVAEGVFSLYQL